MAEKYPDIEIVSKMGFQDENGCDVVADAMITQNPDIQAIFAHWDIPCEGALSALRAAGRDDILLSTIDLGNNIAKRNCRGKCSGTGRAASLRPGRGRSDTGSLCLAWKKKLRIMLQFLQNVWKKQIF